MTSSEHKKARITSIGSIVTVMINKINIRSIRSPITMDSVMKALETMLRKSVMVILMMILRMMFIFRKWRKSARN